MIFFLCAFSVSTETAREPRSNSRRVRFGGQRSLNFGGSASLSLLFDLIRCTVADKREHAKRNRLGSRAGRADSGRRARRRSLGDLGRGTGNRLLSRMQRAVDTSAQPVFPTSSRSARARRRQSRNIAPSSRAGDSADADDRDGPLRRRSRDRVGAEGCVRGRELLHEIKLRGYTGSFSHLERLLAKWRRARGSGARDNRGNSWASRALAPWR
jgi:hypothetical protein